MSLQPSQNTQSALSLGYHPIAEPAIPRNANLRGVQKWREGQQVFVLAMEADRGARNLGVIKVLRAEPPTVRLMEVAKGASDWVVPKVLRVGQNFA